MKVALARMAVCISCSLIFLACSSAPEKPASPAGTPEPVAKWQPTALGEISADRCIYFGEAEEFTEKAGGDIDLKGGASKGKCLGSRWGERLSDYAAYSFELAQPSESTVLVLKTAFDGTKPNPYEVLVDGTAVKAFEIGPSGGFGYSESEWKTTSVALDSIAQGRHTLTLKPGRAGAIINIDCYALGKTK
jgi:hypothetical protein